MTFKSLLARVRDLLRERQQHTGRSSMETQHEQPVNPGETGPIGEDAPGGAPVGPPGEPEQGTGTQEAGIAPGEEQGNGEDEADGDED